MPAIRISERDLERLRALVTRYEAGRDAAAAEQLELELERAVVLPAGDVPRDLVTMHARVLFEDGTGKRRHVTLVYPWEAEPARGRISVLAPVGAALIGLSAGQAIAWPLPTGRTAEFTIIEVSQESDP